MASGRDTAQEARDFSLVLGGPLFQLLLRAHLSDDALNLIRRRVGAITAFVWLPLLVMSALDGDLTGPRLAVPFLRDIETHIRFLVVLPLLLIAEPIVHQRLHDVGLTFLERDLIPPGALPRFNAALHSILRLRNSVLAELLLIALVYMGGILTGHRTLHGTTWHATSWVERPDGTLSPAGFWYAYVSVPAFQFLLLRWYYRLFLWGRFLWQVSRIHLTLTPTHPDLLAGLGFLAMTAYAFTVLLLAHGAMLAGQIAGRIFLTGASLPQFKDEIGLVLLFVLCLVFGPLLVFSPQLARAKRAGLLQYGTLAERYVRDFDVKWLRGGAAAAPEPLLGNSDIQSLADLANSFTVVRNMRVAPITRDAVLRLTAAVLLPVMPLLLTLMPLEELLKKLVGLVL